MTAFTQGDPVYNIRFTNGRWFNGQSFEPRTVYSVDGLFRFQKPERTDTTVDLAGAYIIPPFAEGHNHNLGTGVMEWDRKAIRNYIGAGVLYVKIPGNLPVDAATKATWGINRPGSIDVAFAQGNITSPGGHPIGLMEHLLTRGFFPGHTRESLRDFRYFTIDSENELDQKWEKILASKPDFIKVLLSQSDKYEKLKNDSSVRLKGLNPLLLPYIVQKAHRDGLRVTAHVINAADFHEVVVAGVDEIAHLPRFQSGIPHTPVTLADARLAASKGIPVMTTCAISLFQGGAVKPADIPEAKRTQAADLKTLHDQGVKLAIGSDNPEDNSTREVFYLKELGVFDNLALLNMWTGNTARVIFPGRKIGALKEGYEASFLALEGNPLEDLQQVKKIRMRFKQGVFLE